MIRADVEIGEGQPTSPGRALVLFLSGEDIGRLLSGLTFELQAEQSGLPVHLHLIFGPTDEVNLKRLGPAIMPETKFSDPAGNVMCMQEHADGSRLIVPLVDNRPHCLKMTEEK